MRTLILTHDKMPGEIELRYDNRPCICTLIIRGEPKPETIQWAVNHMPVTPDEGLPIFRRNGFKVTEVQQEITFELFWDTYKQKVKRDRCVKLWERMSQAERIRAYNGIAVYFRHLSENTWKSKADPETYLRNKYWLNEYK